MNQYLINELKEKYKNKRVLPFIGAGLSIPLNLQSWEQLVDELKKDFLKREMWPAIDDSLEKGDYQEAIKDIKKYGSVNDQQIQEKISDNYSLDKIDFENVEDNNYQDLLKDNFKVYVTTNYDRLIEKYIPNIHSFNSLLDYTSDVQRLFNNDKEKYLFHIHGCISNPDSIVISPEKYDELYSNEQFDNKMKTFSSSYSFLFLGFSFSDRFVKELVKNHKEFFKGTHYLLTGNNHIDQNTIIKLRDQFGIKIIKYDISDSSHIHEIRKLLSEITNEKPNLMSPYKISNPAIGLEGLEKIHTHENNLFYQKLEIANVGENLIKVSGMFYLAAEKFIRNCKDLGLPKEFIDGILGEIFMTYQEKYIEIYDDKKRNSKDLLTEIHKNLGEIDLERLVKENKPTSNESKGFIHILADDNQKEIWWGDERL